MAEELRETRMDGRDSVELKWQKEFDAMGEAGVREEFFKGTFQASQRKEGFAYRWLGEKRKAKERTNRRRGRIIWSVLLIVLISVIVGGAVFILFPDMISLPFLR